MRSVHRTWPARLIATVTTLALMFASPVGACAHAAGHAHHSNHNHAGHDHASHDHSVAHATHVMSAEVQAAAADAEPVAVDGERKADTGKCHTDCCDTICHGGYAVLGATTVISLPVRSLPGIAAATLGADTRRGSLERPPRSPVLA